MYDVCRYHQDIVEKFTLGKVLGKGQFGTTRIAIHKETGEKFACKTISKRKIVKQQVQISQMLQFCLS
jgi:calcium-dependent protein kinase